MYLKCLLSMLKVCNIYLATSYERMDNILKFHSSDGFDFLSYVALQVINGMRIFPVHPAFQCSPQIKVTGCQIGASWRPQILTYYSFTNTTTTKNTTQFRHWHCSCVRSGGILQKITSHAFSIRKFLTEGVKNVTDVPLTGNCILMEKLANNTACMSCTPHPNPLIM